jgi:hypothetical protein
MLLVPSTAVFLVLDAAYGPVVCLAAVLGTWRFANRPSIRAAAWLVGGGYSAIQLIVVSNALAEAARAQRVGNDAFTPVLDAASMAVGSLGLALLTLILVLPVARLARRHASQVVASVAIWTSEIARGGFGGAVLGSAVYALLPRPESLEPTTPMDSRIVLVVIGAVLGIVVGGLRADARQRLRGRSNIHEQA